MATKLRTCSSIYRDLKAKLKSFGQEYARVDFRVYHSGAHGPRQALQHAFEDNTPRQGLPFVEVPFTWRYIPMQWNMQTRTYEEDPTIYSLPERGLGHKRGTLSITSKNSRMMEENSASVNGETSQPPSKLYEEFFWQPKTGLEYSSKKCQKHE